MGLKIRLRQQGRNNRPFYRVVVADIRSPRDGKYVEELGWYNPFEATNEKALLLKLDRIQHWLNCGAQLSECVESLVSKVEPGVVKQLVQKQVAHRTKAREKRKARTATRKQAATAKS